MRGGDGKRKGKERREGAPRHCRSEANEKERREMSEGELKGKGERDGAATASQRTGHEKLIIYSLYDMRDWDIHIIYII
jgi:hypothetical protein